MGVGGQHHAPTALTPEKGHGNRYTGGLVDLRVGPEGSEKSRHTGIRSPD
jgi:hypothetical protein